MLRVFLFAFSKITLEAYLGAINVVKLLSFGVIFHEVLTEEAITIWLTSV